VRSLGKYVEASLQHPALKTNAACVTVG
jgi:hypothetical protein